MIAAIAPVLWYLSRQPEIIHVVDHEAIKLPPDVKLSPPDTWEIFELQDGTKYDTLEVLVPIGLKTNYAVLPVTAKGMPRVEKYHGGIRMTYFFEGQPMRVTYGTEKNYIRPSLGAIGEYNRTILPAVGAETKLGPWESVLALGYDRKDKSIAISWDNDIYYRFLRGSLTMAYWKEFSGTFHVRAVF